MKKKIVFITGLHKKPQCCGASVASAAGSFITQKKNASKIGEKRQNEKPRRGWENNIKTEISELVNRIS
jgi:hypothetical protein